jgi:hypothetical protein
MFCHVLLCKYTKYNKTASTQGTEITIYFDEFRLINSSKGISTHFPQFFGTKRKRKVTK